MWVACTDAWCGSQCWLKWVADPSKPTTRGSGGTTPWTSGTIHKDVPSEQPVPSETALNATRVVALRTSAGDLRIALKPEWHQPSVRFVQHAALGDFCTVEWHPSPSPNPSPSPGPSPSPSPSPNPNPNPNPNPSPSPSPSPHQVKCELYRAEPGFLLQGAMRALVTPNTACREFPGGPKECTLTLTLNPNPNPNP